jgi:DNA anti-recombination protein RmuC
MAQSSTRVESLSAAMMKRFGGVDGLADSLKSHIDAAMTRYPGSRAVGTLLQSIVRMIEESDRSQAEAEVAMKQEIEQMSGEELERMNENLRQQFLRKGGTEEQF